MVLALAGCSVPEVEDAAAPSPSVKTPTRIPAGPIAAVGPVTAASVATAKDRLGKLVVQERVRGDAGYSRDAFGPSWTDIDDNGCNQRDDVLLRDSVRGTTTVQDQGRCYDDVLAGTWVDPYTGGTLTFTDLTNPSQAQAIQIDHIVPLAEAWVSGASVWTDQRRLEFANTFSVLLAVDGPTNASKGASDPAAWRPRKAYQCRYAIRWIAIKHTWKLAADPSEVRALEEMLGFC